MKKKILKFIGWFFGIILGIAFALFLAFQLSPRPGAFLINHMFSNTVQITDQKTFNQAEKNVAKKTDLTYESNYKENTISTIQKTARDLFLFCFGYMVEGSSAEINQVSRNLRQN